MKNNHKKIRKLILIATISFSIILTGCGAGGGGTGGGGGGSTKRTNPEMSILSINKGSIGTYSNTNVSKINRGDSVVLTIGINTADVIETCGYQCALQFDSDKFDVILNTDTDNADMLNAFDITTGLDSQNKNIVRVVAIPKAKNGKKAIAKQTTQPMVQLAFKAKNKTGNASFVLKNQDEFSNSISIYKSKKAVNLDKLSLGKSMSIKIQ